jgi:transcriptional regulator with XRE-family HTH domain
MIILDSSLILLYLAKLLNKMSLRGVTMNVLGCKIKELREGMNLTQTALGNLINASKTTISNYETGYSSPDIETLGKLADVLETTTDYLIGRSEIRNLQSVKVAETKNSHGFDINELPEEAIKQVEEYIELIKLKYNNTKSK